jgi:hypothetical protein
MPCSMMQAATSSLMLSGSFTSTAAGISRWLL